MRPDRARAAGVALKMAVGQFVGQEATPAVCVRIKKSFVQIMRAQFGVDWTREAWRIQVRFIDGHKPDVRIPPHMLNG